MLFTEKIIPMLLVNIFSSPIMPGAQLFFLIVCILIGLGAGISAADARNTFAKKKKSDH
jgi:F0F1-type ATP synthase assembly protein I